MSIYLGWWAGLPISMQYNMSGSIMNTNKKQQQREWEEERSVRKYDNPYYLFLVNSKRFCKLKYWKAAGFSYLWSGMHALLTQYERSLIIDPAHFICLKATS